MLLVALLALVLASPASAAPWRWPLRGDVLTPFHLTANRFAPGQHRGIDIAAAAGARVRSACPGRVRFAGRLPGRAGVVSVTCGGLVATYLELATLAVRRGEEVAAGAPIGTVAASHVQLGARRAGTDHGYVDPLTLLGTAAPPPLGAAPARLRAGRPASPSAPRLAPARTPQATRAANREPARIPLAAWAGLALVAAAIPVGVVSRRRRWRSARAVFSPDG